MKTIMGGKAHFVPLTVAKAPPQWLMEDPKTGWKIDMKRVGAIGVKVLLCAEKTLQAWFTFLFLLRINLNCLFTVGDEHGLE